LALIAEQIADHEDRGFVLLCGAVLDRALEKLIRAKFAKLSNGAQDSIDFLLSDQPVPPLGSAGVRARLACAMGLIDGGTENALAKFFHIRNEFAHTEVPPALDDALVNSIRDRLPNDSKGYLNFRRFSDGF
jgi:DNA-binding MltR family transcriptional regulator